VSSGEAAATMFELYRDRIADRHRVVFFTDLDETHRDREIEQAPAGVHVLGGFLASAASARGRELLAAYVARLNAGERIPPAEIEAALAALSRAGEA